MRWELERSFDGKWCQKSLHQKLLKSVNSSSSQSTILGMPFDVILFILTHILLVLFSSGTAEAELCQKCLYQKLLKLDMLSLSDNR